jgi:antitoxin component YwqK of YwqJK toxin-antitoxin module
MKNSKIFILFCTIFSLYSTAYSQHIKRGVKHSKNSKRSDINRIDRNGHYQGFWKFAMPDTMGHTSNVLEGIYFNDKKVGVWALKNYKGIVLREEIYYDTFQHKVQLNEYYYNGNFKSSGFMYPVNQKDSITVYDEKTGKPKLFSVDSVLMKQYKWSYYYDNGLLESEGAYKNDKKKGTWKYYNEKGEMIKTETYD